MKTLFHSVLAACIASAALAATQQPASPIHISFVIHFDPLPAPGGQVLRLGYEAERDNLAWLVEFLERIEKEKGKEFVPRLTLEMAGDHAEWYLEDEKGFDLLRRLHQKGIHCWGTHFHTNYQKENHLWVQAPQSPDSAPRVTYDHIAAVDKLIGKIIGSDDPKAIRKVNCTITGHMLDMEMAAKKGFDTLTGGRNEAMNLFFDHDVYTPWRPAMGWPLAEDLSSHWVLIPQAPVPGRIGEHCPIPQGVPEEYTRGMRQQIWQDLSIPALQRKFLHLYLEWRHSSHDTRHSPFVFGWHEHTNDLFPDDATGRQKKLRRELVELVEWLNANFIGKGARYANTDEVRDEFLAWEKAHPQQSSFNYPVRTRDWEKYPYQLKGLARELMYAHCAQEITTFKDKGVHVHKLLKTDGRTWDMRGREVVCTKPTKDIYLLWGEKGTQTIDFSSVVAGKLRRVEGASGKESAADSKSLIVSTEPVIVALEETPIQNPTPKAFGAKSTIENRDARMPIQFRMNVNYFPDEAVARENCKMLRRYLDLFKQAGAKASFWFTGLAADQVQRIDPEFIRLLNEAGMPVAHHGANRPPNPQPIHRVKGENWDEDVQAILDYESHALDPKTGTLDKTRIGGLKKMQQTFGDRIKATGRFFEASILYVTKLFGCQAMIGLKGNTGGSTNAGWFLGMMGMPDALSIAPDMLRAAAQGKLDLFRFIEKSAVDQPAKEAQSVAVLIHDHDFLQGSPVLPQVAFLRGSAELQRQLWDTYEKLVKWAVKHPRFRVVTSDDILDHIADDRTKTVSRAAMLKAAEAVAASRAAPPEYVDLEGDYLSLADTFQAFALALAHFAQHGKLPESVVTRDILGPTRYRAEERPERGALEFVQDEDHLRPLGRSTTDPQTIATTPTPQSVDIETPGTQIIAAAKSLDLTKEIPFNVTVNGKEINPAVFLHLMAQTIQNLSASQAPGTVRVRGVVNVLPLQVQQNRLADALTKLQFWTFKPLRWKAEDKSKQANQSRSVLRRA
jgi:hypothetical protein